MKRSPPLGKEALGRWSSGAALGQSPAQCRGRLEEASGGGEWTRAETPGRPKREDKAQSGPDEGPSAEPHTGPPTPRPLSDPLTLDCFRGRVSLN